MKISSYHNIFTAIRGSFYKIGAKENLHVNVSRYKIMNIINKIAKERSVSILMTSHDLNSALPSSDYIICINNTIYYQGKPDEIMEINEIFGSYAAK
ncbi:hypothetical protein GZ064_00415 [Wolbachia endosymbiont of Diaphorina citri]|nr:hypothetical protein GZ064_00415 [Wolbachia endosymbiont of Diaphorina citri]